tara:strand:+ start:3897 stop:5069 length:1173 start_codon:yes stop_codon:yes gene_type:complete
MGSVVKSIGKVFKKIGKGLKKIAPVLLIAAAAYVGYGYATGWQGAGWPRITEWGKSLMGGVRGGSTLSESAVQASEVYANPASGMATSAVTTPASFPPDVVGEVTDGTTYLGPNVEPFNPITTQSGTPVTSNTTFLGSSAQPVSPITTQSGSGLGLLGESQPGFLESIGNTLVPPAGAATPSGSFAGQQLYSGPGIQDDVATDVATDVAQSTASGSTLAALEEIPDSSYDQNTLTGSGPGLETLGTQSTGINKGNLQDISNWSPGYSNASDTWDWLKDKIPTELMGEAWGFYKNLWQKDPLVALYGSQKVLEMVLTYLDKSEETKSYQKRHVAGMPPRSMSDVMKTHKRAKAAGLRHNKTGIWADSGVKMSSINNQPPGLLGRNPQRTTA